LLFDRKVTRVITPGTLIDEKFMDPWENNYLLSVHVEPSPSESEMEHDGEATKEDTPKSEPSKVGLAWIDLSSGDFFTQVTDFAALPSVVARIGPREIILDNSLRDSKDPHFLAMVKEDRHIVSYHSAPKRVTSPADWNHMLDEGASGFNEAAFSPEELAAGSFLMHYVSTQLQGKTARLQAPVSQHADEYMAIDRNTLRALEIRTTLRDGKHEGSLLHAVRRTVTKSGARLLNQRLSKFPQSNS